MGGADVARRVVIEGESDALDADLCELFEEGAAGCGAAERGHARDVVGAKDVRVEHALDEHEITTNRGGTDVREGIGQS